MNHGKDGDEEREAITALKRKDINGLDALARIHQLRAVRTAYLIVGDRSAAEDVVADAFVLVYERIDQYDPRRPFAPWFYRIVVNGALKWLRRSRNHFSIEAVVDELRADSPSPDELAIEGETRDHIMAAVQRLSPEQRAVVVLRYYLDMDEREIAKTLRCPLGTVKWRLHRAKKHLRNTLSQPQVKAALAGRWET